MDYRNNKNVDPWDEGVYGTGNTMPPKNHSGIITLLLILVIFLSGIISVLSFLNIRLFQQLTQQQEQLEQAPMSFSDTDIQRFPVQQPDATITLRPGQEDVSLRLHQSPQSVENVPEAGVLSLQEIYEKVIPSLVCVSSATDTGNIAGSGVILSPRGYILTTCRAVSGAETINVTLSDGRSFSALIIGADALTDLAVLYVDAQDLPAAEFGSSDSLRVGDSVTAMSAQMSGSLAEGIISAINRSTPEDGLSLIQSSALMQMTSSGGPLINCYGQIIGIHTFRQEAEGSGFAIPSASLKQVVDQLIAQGYVSGRPTLGITGEAITEFDQYYFHIPAGLYIDEIDYASDAYVQELAPGDILISIDGVPVPNQQALDAIVYSHAIGDVVTALVYRDGQEQTITLTVTEYAG